MHFFANPFKKKKTGNRRMIRELQATVARLDLTIECQQKRIDALEAAEARRARLLTVLDLPDPAKRVIPNAVPGYVGRSATLLHITQPGRNGTVNGL